MPTLRGLFRVLRSAPKWLLPLPRRLRSRSTGTLDFRMKRLQRRARSVCGHMVPHDLGGEGASIADVVDVCYMLGRACASTAMIYAMHQTKVACCCAMAGRAAGIGGCCAACANEQLLLASSTTEGQAGGDVRKSAAPVS